MKFGIDLDGVVVDFTTDWRNCYAEAFGVLVPASHGWNALVDLTHFGSSEEFFDWLSTTECWMNSDPLPGAIETLWKLHDDGHHIAIITSKPPWAIPRTLQWLANHDIPLKEIHITGGGIKKSSVVCDVYVDDSPINLRELHENRPESTVIQVVQPWNEQENCKADLQIDFLHQIPDVLGLERQKSGAYNQ